MNVLLDTSPAVCIQFDLLLMYDGNFIKNVLKIKIKNKKVLS